ncbi:hypothetical protein [Flavobacterium suncheonense]|uniref:hypothetical protein n=1 Tax=Flavobacterium suncheonense TaxID=350894 RepID=UPI003FA3C031
MKKIAALGFLFALLMGCASASKNEINQQLDSQSGKEVVLVRVLNDSRCPEGVQCVWAGEVTIEVAVYENKKLSEQTQFTLNAQSADEVKAWFEQHLPPSKEKLKAVSVAPYPKEGVTIQPEEYKIVLKY